MLREKAELSFATSTSEANTWVFLGDCAITRLRITKIVYERLVTMACVVAGVPDEMHKRSRLLNVLFNKLLLSTYQSIGFLLSGSYQRQERKNRSTQKVVIE